MPIDTKQVLKDENEAENKIKHRNENSNSELENEKPENWKF